VNAAENNPKVLPSRAEIEPFYHEMLRFAPREGQLFLALVPDKDNGRREVGQVVNLAHGPDAVVDAAFGATLVAAARGDTALTPPMSVFKPGARTRSEDEVLAGLNVMVDADHDAALDKLPALEAVLGPPRIKVASGGKTKQGRDKLHVYWLLRYPATDTTSQAKLRRARQLACAAVDGDASAAPLSHCFRLPGSVHNKGAPRLCRTLEIAPGDVGILDDLDATLERLEAAAPATAKALPPVGDPGQRSDQRTFHELVDTILAGHEGTVNAAMATLVFRMAKGGMPAEEIQEFVEGLLDRSEIDAERHAMRLAQLEPMISRAVRKLEAQSERERRTLEEAFAEYLPDPETLVAADEIATAGRAQTSTSSIAFIDFTDPASWNPPPMQFIIGGWAPLGYVSSCYGPGGIGKSLLAQMIAVCIATGRPFFGAPVLQGTVLGFFCEDDDQELMRRQKRICEAMGVSPEEIGDRIKLQGRVGLDNMQVSYVGNEPKIGKFLAEIRAAVEEHRPKLLILDNIAQLFGGDEDIRFQVANFCNHVAGLMRGMEGAVLLFGHPAKGENSEYSGSTGWDGSVRSRWFLRYADKDDKGSGRLILSKAKANYAEQSDLSLRRINGVHVADDETTWTDAQRFQMAARGDRAKDVVLRALSKLREQRVKVASSPFSPAGYAPKIILEKGLNEGVPKAELETALTELISTGTVVAVEIGKNEHRKPIVSLAPAGHFSAEKSAGGNSKNPGAIFENDLELPEDPPSCAEPHLYRGVEVGSAHSASGRAKLCATPLRSGAGSAQRSGTTEISVEYEAIDPADDISDLFG
jgi:RecA-family ATPase